MNENEVTGPYSSDFPPAPKTWKGTQQLSYFGATYTHWVFYHVWHKDANTPAGLPLQS